MDEETILSFRNRAVPYFERVLAAEGYDPHRAAEIGFFVAKVLEDTLALVEDVNSSNPETDDVLNHIHRLYANQFAFDSGNKILMYQDTE